MCVGASLYVSALPTSQPATATGAVTTVPASGTDGVDLSFPAFGRKYSSASYTNKFLTVTHKLALVAVLYIYIVDVCSFIYIYIYIILLEMYVYIYIHNFYCWIL